MMTKKKRRRKIIIITTIMTLQSHLRGIQTLLILVLMILVMILMMTLILMVMIMGEEQASLLFTLKHGKNSLTLILIS